MKQDIDISYKGTPTGNLLVQGGSLNARLNSVLFLIYTGTRWVEIAFNTQAS